MMMMMMMMMVKPSLFVNKWRKLSLHLSELWMACFVWMKLSKEARFSFCVIIIQNTIKSVYIDNNDDDDDDDGGGGGCCCCCCWWRSFSNNFQCYFSLQSTNIFFHTIHSHRCRCYPYHQGEWSMRNAHMSVTFKFDCYLNGGGSVFFPTHIHACI